MTDPLFSRPPPCPRCSKPTAHVRYPDGGVLTECTSCHEYRHGALTLATAPWTAPVVAAVLEVVDAVADEGCGTPEAEAVLRDIREDLAGRRT